MKNNINQKHFFETAIMNGTGMWNGYAMLPDRFRPEVSDLLRLMGTTLNGDYMSRFEELYPPERLSKRRQCVIHQAPKLLDEMKIVDEALEASYGTITRASLKCITQCNITMDEPFPKEHWQSKYGAGFSEFSFWLLFRVKPSIKLEKRTFHTISVTLKYVYDYYQKNVPNFKIQVKVPDCLVQESLKNPEFMLDLRKKLSF